jgi:2-iminobutanoate/2-iminopropanoate deaminase
MKTIITTGNAPAAIGPYSQAVQINDLLFVSGQIPMDPETGNLVEGDIEVQTKQVLENLKAIIEAAAMDLQNVVKCSCFLKDMNDFVRFNSVYEAYFPQDPPAREAVQVARLPKDVSIEISAICSRS